jgi:hypothetical protein
MAYWFAGFFAKPIIIRPSLLSEGAVWRDITAPFHGVGVYVGSLINQTPPLDEVSNLAQRLGIGGATDWIFLRYICWAGQVEFIYGLGSRGGRRFGPVEASDVGQARDMYVGLIAEFGVEEADALRFPPFERGFWGDN